MRARRCAARRRRRSVGGYSWRRRYCCADAGWQKPSAPAAAATAGARGAAGAPGAARGAQWHDEAAEVSTLRKWLEPPWCAATYQAAGLLDLHKHLVVDLARAHRKLKQAVTAGLLVVAQVEVQHDSVRLRDRVHAAALQRQRNV